MPSLATLKNCF